MEETFTYDGMNRLTGVTLKRPSGQDLVCSVTYDALGRMTSRQAVTAENGAPQVTSVFSDAVYNTTAKPHAMDAATTAEGVFPATPQAVTYTGFDKVAKVVQGDDSVCFVYGHDRRRILMEEHVGGLTRAKQYWGACEYVTESDGTTTNSCWRTFVTGPYGVFAVVESRNGVDETHYVLKDNLGSWTTITDGEGTVEQRLSYDAWGNLRDPNTWANYTVGDTFDKPMFDRGYTGHEHLADFGLINMNGRVYDPVMSSFLSADRFVQNPLTAQGFNRYSYCMNNPLRFIDPTGWLPGDGGSGGSLPHIIIGGQTNYILPEITIRPDDNPSLSNPHEKPNYPMHYYGSSPTDLPAWGDPSNGPSIGWSNGTGCGGGSGTHGNGNQNSTPQNININIEIGSKVLVAANVYTSTVAKSYYNEIQRTWTDRLGIRRSFDFLGNQHTGGIKSFGKMMSNRFLKASGWLNGIGVGVSTIQMANADNINDRIRYGSDMVIGLIGFAPGGNMICTFWFFGGRELVFQYGETMGTLLEDGINPGYPVYQPFK